MLFSDTSETNPDNSMVLGRDLGPAMTRKILKLNCQVVYCSTVRSLTSDKMMDGTMNGKPEVFTEKVNAVPGDGFKC